MNTAKAFLQSDTQSEALKSFQRDPGNFEGIRDVVDAAISSWRMQWQDEMEQAAYDYFNLTATFTRFLIIVTPYDSDLRNRSLSEPVRDQYACFSGP